MYPRLAHNHSLQHSGAPAFLPQRSLLPSCDAVESPESVSTFLPRICVTTQMSIQAYVNDGTITAEEAATMSSTQLEFLIRKRTRSGSPVPAPGASSAVPYRPGQRSSSAPQQPIASTPVRAPLAWSRHVHRTPIWRAGPAPAANFVGTISDVACCADLHACKPTSFSGVCLPHVQVAGGLGGGMGVNEAELSPEQLELLQVGMPFDS